MTVRHSQGSYAIVPRVADNLFDALPPSSFIITDDNVANVWRRRLENLPVLRLTPGEGNKSLQIYGRCLEWMATSGATRHATVVALGGGVIGDLAGFVAATYMRGVRLVQIPTTLLAQVDSSVGGKVGIDLPSGKNLVGAFYPPSEVRVAVDVLSTLPARQFACGMAEVWKYGAIMDGELFGRLSERRTGPGDPALAEIVNRCIALKAEVVEADEFERTGRRAILNFGHTVAHAIESITGYGPVLHGEAVAIGMVLEARLGERLSVTPTGTASALSHLLSRDGLPVRHPIVKDSESMIAAMRRDKKAVDGRLAFSLLTQIGGCKLVEGVREADVRAALEEG